MSFLFKFFVVIVLLFCFTNTINAVEISTPWNDELNWQNTWQSEIYQTLRGYNIGKFFVSFFSDLQKKQDQKNLENLRKQDPFLDLIHKNELQKKKHIEKLIPKINREIDLDILIEHIKVNEKKLQKQGKELYPAYKKLLKDLEHYKSVLKNKELNKATRNTMMMGVVALAVRLIIMLGAGV